MVLGDEIQMIIGTNFILAMHGGIRIEGNVVTFYKNLSTINTLPSVNSIAAIRNNQWQGDRAIIATMEVNLTRGSQLVYIIPDIMLTVGDFYRNIQLAIQTRGYDQWRNGEANLLLTRGLVGRLSNTPNVGFTHEIRGVVD